MNYKPSSLRRFSSPSQTPADFLLLTHQQKEEAPSCPIIAEIPQQVTQEEANGTQESPRRNRKMREVDQVFSKQGDFDDDSEPCTLLRELETVLQTVCYAGFNESRVYEGEKAILQIETFCGNLKLAVNKLSKQVQTLVERYKMKYLEDEFNHLQLASPGSSTCVPSSLSPTTPQALSDRMQLSPPSQTYSECNQASESKSPNVLDFRDSGSLVELDQAPEKKNFDIHPPARQFFSEQKRTSACVTQDFKTNTHKEEDISPINFESIAPQITSPSSASLFHREYLKSAQNHLHQKEAKLSTKRIGEMSPTLYNFDTMMPSQRKMPTTSGVPVKTQSSTYSALTSPKALKNSASAYQLGNNSRVLDISRASRNSSKKAVTQNLDDLDSEFKYGTGISFTKNARKIDFARYTPSPGPMTQHSRFPISPNGTVFTKSKIKYKWALPSKENPAPGAYRPTKHFISKRPPSAPLSKTASKQ